MIAAARRIVSGALLVVIVATMTFFLLYLGSGNIARNILGPLVTPEQVDALNAQLGLDRPVWVQFTSWAQSALGGDLGVSYANGQPVTETLLERLPVTLSLVIVSTLVTGVAACILGVHAARRGGATDRAIQSLTVIGAGVPGFISAIVLVTIFAVTLRWVAPTGYTDFAESPSGWLGSIALPVIALSLASIAGVTQQVRGAVVDVLSQDYVRTLRSRGFSEMRVVYKHALRNAAGPGLSVLGLQFVGLLGGAVIVEQIFALPGLGQLTVTATSQGDIPLVLGIVIATSVLVFLVNLVIELARSWLNPKVRTQ